MYILFVTERPYWADTLAQLNKYWRFEDFPRLYII